MTNDMDKGYRIAIKSCLKNLDSLSESPEIAIHCLRAILKAQLEFGLFGDSESGWISVKDRLPDHSVYCLIYDDEECEVEKACYRSEEHSNSYPSRWSISNDRDIHTDFVSYWMPLPEPPEKE